nr:uncharacterized protein LOC107439359 [Parasteatoda tepidariorum]
MTCTPKDESRMEGSVVWTDEEGREIINARFTKLDNDDLEVTNAYVGDSGTYKCKYRSLATPEGLNKVYERKLLVYELAGHKFISSAVFDVSKQDEKAVIDMLKDLLTYKVCTRDLCAPGVVRTTKCEDKSCEFFISYEALNQVADDQCDEECIRTKMLNGLKQFLVCLATTVSPTQWSAACAMSATTKRVMERRIVISVMKAKPQTQKVRSQEMTALVPKTRKESWEVLEMEYCQFFLEDDHQQHWKMKLNIHNFIYIDFKRLTV